MKKIDLGQTITILANIGVIAGIVFLGFELRQNNRLIASEARAVRASMNQTGWGFVIENPDLIALLVRDRNGEPLTAEEQFRLNANWMQNLAQRQFDFFESPDSAAWVAGQRRNFEAYSSLRNAWNGVGLGSISAGKDNFDPRFVQFYDENVANPR